MTIPTDVNECPELFMVARIWSILCMEQPRYKVHFSWGQYSHKWLVAYTNFSHKFTIIHLAIQYTVYYINVPWFGHFFESHFVHLLLNLQTQLLDTETMSSSSLVTLPPPPPLIKTTIASAVMIRLDINVSWFGHFLKAILNTSSWISKINFWTLKLCSRPVKSPPPPHK